MSIFKKDLKIRKRFEVVLDKSSEGETEEEELEKDEEDSLHDKVQAEENEIVKRKASNALLPAASGTAVI